MTHTSKSQFKDYFSGQSAVYARYRPQYPTTLFEYLASVVAERHRAWDCATGNGQAALSLIQTFDQVVATDASEQQIVQAAAHDRIWYVVSSAEATPIRSRTMNLITVAQAVHWFDFGKFFREVDRVMVPGGILAVWSYGWMQSEPAIDELLDKYRTQIVESYWPPESRHVAENYCTIPFPLKELKPPSMTMEKTWTMDDLLGYLESWSATQNYIKRNGTNPIDLIREDLEKLWWNALTRKVIRWPLNLRVGKI